MPTLGHDERPAPRADAGLRELGEDAIGFGQLEIRTLWHSVIRPAQVLEAYMTGGPSGGGQYARPLRLYLGLCGIMMLMLFLMGGSDMLLGTLPTEIWTPLLEQSGKSRDAFLSDFDGWVTLVLVPITSLVTAIFAAPLLRMWDPEAIGWRRGFRATFHFLNAWTIVVLPLAWLGYVPRYALIANLLFLVVAFVVFLRTGKGRWYRTRVGGIVKALAFTLLTYVAGSLAYLPIFAIGLAGALLA